MQLLHARSSGSVKRQPIEAQSVHNDTRRSKSAVSRLWLTRLREHGRCVIDRVIGFVVAASDKADETDSAATGKLHLVYVAVVPLRFVASCTAAHVFYVLQPLPWLWLGVRRRRQPLRRLLGLRAPRPPSW